MNASDSDNRVCERCGAPLGHHTREGLCTRCIARFTLLESEDNGQKAEDGSRRSEGGDRNLGSPSVSSVTSCASLSGSEQEATEGTEADVSIGSEAINGSLGPTGVQPARRSRFGDYELIEEIAHGGMGVVYRARQASLKRIVAVKMLLFGQFAGKAAFDRFRAEAQTAAHLQHPNIVAVHEIGETDGQPYFSMDYVAGRNLAELVRDRPMPARQAAGYLRKIAQAVHYAHVHGVLHRDLKPANVLIDEADEPRITDFGLARQLAGDSGLTLTGQVLGSPNFMPPEQGTGKRAKVGPASDIYGLGALLYYLLTARPPFLAETFEATLAQVLNTEPVAPRQLNPGIPRDLETICLKCLEKDPARRYASAAELAAELDRFLGDEPILARSIGPAGKMWRWCRRKPALSAMAAAVVTLLLTVTAVSVASAWRIASARKGEQREAYYSNIALANQYIEQGSIDRALETLWKCPEQYRHWEWGHLLYLCHQEAASFQAHTTNIYATVFSPDGRWVSSHDAAGIAKVWDWEAEQQVFSFGSSSNRASWITFRPSGGQLAAILGTNGVWVWTTTNWTSIPRSTASLNSGNVIGADSGAVTENEKQGLLFTLHPPTGEITTLAYSPDGAQLVTGCSDGTMTVWDSASGQELNRLVVTNQWINRVAISPDGRRLVTVAERAAWVWELDSGKLIRSFPDDPDSPIFAVFADDAGRHFAVIDPQGRLTLWRKGQAPQQLITIRGGLPHPVRRVFFSPDGRWMANAGDENTARVWDLSTGTERLAISERVQSVDFSCDGSRMVTHGAETWVTTWDLTQGRILKTLRGHMTVVNDARLSQDGRLAVSAGETGIVKVWNAGPGRELAQDRAWQRTCTYSPDGRLIANCPWHEGVVIRSTRSGRELLRIHPPNETFLVAAFSPDNRRLATGGTHKTAKVWDAETGQLLLRLRGHRREISAVAYSGDGAWIATGGFDGAAKVWDANTGLELLDLPMDPVMGYALLGLSNRVMWVQFDARDERLLTAGTDGKARVWNLDTGKLVATFVGGEPGIGRRIAHFLPDQRRLVTSHGNCIRIWDISTGRLLTEATGRGMDDAWSCSRDGRRMFTASWEGTSGGPGSGHGVFEIWDIERSPRRILERARCEGFTRLALSPDDRTVACVGLDYCVHQWETFPWREEDYAKREGQRAQGGGQRSEVSGQWSVVRSQKSEAEWAENVRQYARGYWRERLQAELHGAEGEPTAPRVIEVAVERTLFSQRDPSATARQVDLTDFYTGELGETFHGKVGNPWDHDDDLSELAVGLVELGGVKFDVRGVIQLRRAEPLGGAWEFVTLDDPVRVDGIPIQQEATRLHLLLGTVSEGTVLSGGTVIGRLELHYADGETRPLEVVYGRDVLNWWYEPAKVDTEVIDRASVVWTGTNPVANEYGHRLRLYLNTRENPRPGVKITTFDFVSAMSESGPFLIAVTLEE